MAFKEVAAEFPKGPCKIALIGECPGEDEALAGRPFVGNSGEMLNKLLRRVGIDRSACLVTNIFNERPINNEVERFFIGVKAAKAINYSPLEPRHTMGFVHPNYKHHLERLRSEILAASPALLVAIGGVALYGLAHLSGIMKYRGTPVQGVLTPHKVLPTIHPAAAFDKWDYWPIIEADLRKAKREAEFKEIKRVKRTIFVAESLNDLDSFYASYHSGCSHIAFDVETESSPPRITSYTVAVSPLVALVVNVDMLGDVSLKYLERWLDKVWILQNAPYDLTWIAEYGIKPPLVEDTMLLHHAWQLELPKSLGFMGSLYTNEVAWKEWREKAKGNYNKDHE